MINFDDPDELKDEEYPFVHEPFRFFGAILMTWKRVTRGLPLAADTAIAFLNEVADGIAETR